MDVCDSHAIEHPNGPNTAELELSVQPKLRPSTEIASPPDRGKFSAECAKCDATGAANKKTVVIPKDGSFAQRVGCRCNRSEQQSAFFLLECKVHHRN